MTLVRCNSDQDGRARLNLSPSNSAQEKVAPTQSLSNFKAFEKYEIVVNNESPQELSLIKWRTATEYPVSKILFHKVLNRKRSSEGIVVQIAIETYISNLQELSHLPLYNILYLTQESLRGFKQLFDRFGGFVINKNMIFINKAGKCKVWCNQNVQENYPQNKAHITELQFKNKLVSLLESKCLKSLLTQQFFTKLYQKEGIIDGILYIQEFCQAKGIIASNSITLGSTAKKNQEIDAQCSKSYQGPCKKIPQFVLDLRKNKKDKSSGSSVSKNSSQSRFQNRKRKFTITSIKSDGVIRARSPKIDEETATHNKNTLKRRGQDVDYTININTPTTPTTQCFYSPKSESLPLPNNMFNFDYVTEKQQQAFLMKNQKGSKFLKDRKLSYQDPLVFNHRSLKRKTTLQNEQRQVIPQSPKQSSKMMQKLQIPVDNLRPPHRSKKNIIRQTIENSPHLQVLMRYTDKKQEEIIEKNGWMKRITSLNVQDFRGTVYSNSDGNDQLAENLLMNSIKLEFLDKLGTQLKGSILQHQ